MKIKTDSESRKKFYDSILKVNINNYLYGNIKKMYSSYILTENQIDSKHKEITFKYNVSMIEYLNKFSKEYEEMK